jgi:hypothetical protein
MVKWAFMTDPDTGNVALYDEPVATGDPADPDAARNAPLNDPEGNLAFLYWHSLLDNMEVLFDTTVTVHHAATAAGSTAADNGANQSVAFDVDAATTDWDVFTHSAGYEPVVFAAVGADILVPGYPIQVPVSADGAARYMTVHTSSTKVFLREFRTRGLAGLTALSQDYRLIGFRPQRAAEGNDPPRLLDFDPDTGLFSMGDGRFRNDRRYLQVVPGGSPLGLPYGRTLDLKNGGFRLAKSNGTTVDPLPNTIKQGIWAPGGTFSTDTLTYGAPMYYDGTWSPSEILEVQAP